MLGESLLAVSVTRGLDLGEGEDGGAGPRADVEGRRLGLEAHDLGVASADLGHPTHYSRYEVDALRDRELDGGLVVARLLELGVDEPETVDRRGYLLGLGALDGGGAERGVSNGNTRHVMFEEFLDQRNFNMIPLTYEEREAGHLNLVVTERSRRAVGFEQAVRIASEMKRRDWELATFPADELWIGNGGAHCVTCPLLVD